MNKLLEKYADHILEYNKIHMLTGFKTKESIEENLFNDSINAFTKINLKGKSLLDIGTGCGIPGIPLKLQEPTLELFLLETLIKRITFLKQVNKYIDFKLIYGRAEEKTHSYKEKFDIVTMRAFSQTSICLEIAAQFAKVGGIIVLLKGPKVIDELKTTKHANKILNLYLEDTIKSGTKKTTITVVYKKMKKTPKKYPRNFGQIKNKPL